MTRALLGSSWMGNFALSTDLQRHLFVPTPFSPGPQPACQRYRTVGEEAYAKELPLFRLQTVLYPGWCVCRCIHMHVCTSMASRMRDL